MTKTARMVLLSLAVAGAGLLATPQESDAQGSQTVPVARRLFDQGVEAARKSKWDVALDRFKRSYDLAPRLKTLFNLAGAQMQTGKLVDASESYRRFLRETNDGRYEAYRKDARDILDKIEKRMPFATIRVLGVSPGDEIKLNDEPLAQAGLGESLPIDPGAHTIDVFRDGSKISSRRFTIGEGDSKSIDIVVEPRPEPVDDSGAVGSKSGDSVPDNAISGGTDPGKDDDGGSIFASGWFWTAVVVVAASGAGAGYFLTRDATADPTQGTLGRGVIDVAP